jgi:DNA polymerase-1
MKKLVLIDSNALVHRAFHALPTLNAPDGRPTNAVYGFTSVLLKMLADLKPDYIAATFDLAGPTFRHLEYEEYKAHRQKAPDELYAQIPMVKEMLRTFGIPIFEQEGYEADDVIGTIAEHTRNIKDLQTVIVTGDLDTLQLVEKEKVVVFTLRKGMTDTIIYDEEGVQNRFGLPPEQIVDFKGLKGDPSDNIPGVPGIGEKTASTLIQKFGSIEHLYLELELEKGGDISEKLRQKLLEHKDIALFSKKLSTIIRNIPMTFDIEQADWQYHLDHRAIEAYCAQLGFHSLAKRIASALHAVASETIPQSLDLDTPPASSAVLVRTSEDLPAGDEVAIHAVVTDNTIEFLYLTVDGQQVYGLSQPSPAQCQEALLRYPVIIGHDLKIVLRLLPETVGLIDRTFIDIAIGAWLLGPDKRDYSLERMYSEKLQKTLSAESAGWPKAIWELRHSIEAHLVEDQLASIFHDIEMPLIPVLACMEQRGIRVDPTVVQELLTIAIHDVQELEQKIYALAGKEFNINSPAQLGEILFTTLSIRGKVRRTSGGAPSTAAAELEKLRDEHPIIELILQYREMAKLKTTYIEPLPALLGPDGRVHTTYNQAGAATGRMSSSNPNLQNIPTRTPLGQKFRAAFVADSEWKLLSLDYSQLELRIVAHIAQDATMVEAFKRGDDIHTLTAAQVFGLDPKEVTKDMRRQAKVLNFGIIYGMGSVGFARASGISRDKAKQFIEEYFARFPGIAAYMEHTKQQAFDQGYVSTILGRRRSLPDIRSRMPQLAATAERMAINHPIQGTAADIVKKAMLDVDRYVRESANEDIRMLLQVHDELVLEVRQSRIDAVVEPLRKIMENVFPLDVPLTVDAKSGDNWSDMKIISHA